MRGVSTPPGIEIGRDKMVWNSLCPIGGDEFLLVSEVKGKVMVYPGNVKREKLKDARSAQK
jgi:hypothetical protein